MQECVYVHTECVRIAMWSAVRGEGLYLFLSLSSLSLFRQALGGWMVFGQSLTIFHQGMCMAPVRLPTTETEWNEEKVKKIDRERDGQCDMKSYIQILIWISNLNSIHAHTAIMDSAEHEELWSQPTS